MHPGYDHFIPLNSKYGKFQPQTNTFSLGITTLLLLNLTVVWVYRLIILKKKKCFSSLRSCYHKLANRNKLILYFTTRNICKILNDVTIGTASKKLLESFTIFQYGQNNGVKIWGFDASRNISRHRKLPLILILQMQ